MVIGMGGEARGPLVGHLLCKESGVAALPTPSLTNRLFTHLQVPREAFRKVWRATSSSTWGGQGW